MKKRFKDLDVDKATAAILILIFLGVVIFSFSACVTEKKVKQWNNDHPEQEARNCAEKYPAAAGDTTVRSSVDTFDFSRDMYDVNEYINWLNAVNDSLINVIHSTDTSCSKYVATLQRLKAQIDSLQNRLKNIRPKIVRVDSTITKLDSAKATTTRLENNRLTREAAEKDKKIASLTSSGKIRFWMLIASGLLNVLLIVLLFKKKSNPIVNAVT